MKSGKWDARIERAAELASKHAFAAEGLRFYGHIAQFQKSLYSNVEAECGAGKEFRSLGSLRQELDLFVLLPKFPPFLALVEEHAPAVLSESASSLRHKPTAHWQQLLAAFWRPGSEPLADLAPHDAMLAWLFLQPYAEYLADHTDHAPVHGTPSECPLCGGKPQLGILRPEGDGGKRSLVCALCATEWEYRRIVCAACGEEDVHKLAVYTAQEFAHVRVEACDSCRRYLKTVDLTKDGHAVPVVDELATIPLNLWAMEHNFTKIQTNFLGI